MNSLNFVSAAIVSVHYSEPSPKLVSIFRATASAKPYTLVIRSYGDLSNKLKVSALKSDETKPKQFSQRQNEWLPAFPHVLVASMSNFIFGYHIGVMNGPIVSIARELGFEGNSFIEGLVVSIFIAGAFIGSISSCSLLDRLGSRLTFQINSIPLILGAIISAQAHSLNEIIGGRFLVGLGIGVNTVLVPIYISEVAPTKYRGALGSLCQIGTCLGIITSLFLGILSENDPHCQYWPSRPPNAMVRRVAERFNVAVVMAAILFPRHLGATLLIYVGAINVLIIFAVMFMNGLEYYQDFRLWTIVDEITLMLISLFHLSVVTFHFYNDGLN